MSKLDSGLVELVGRNFLTAQLLQAGLEVALPVRDRGIDLIAYADLGGNVDRFVGRPIQLKAALNRSFSIDRKYQKFPDLLIAHVWGLDDLAKSCCYLMSHAESVAIGNEMGWTQTVSWEKGYYMTTSPSKKLLALLEPYRMTAEAWWPRIVANGVAIDASADRGPLSAESAALNVLLMVHELHKQGFQRLRIVPGISPSGLHWRVTILPASRVLQTHGALSRDWTWSGPEPFYTSGQHSRYFGWEDAESDPPAELAHKFLNRFHEIAEPARGADWAYAGWYVEMLGRAQAGELPIAYAEFDADPDPRWLPTTKGVDSGLPMPPPGEMVG